MQTVHAHGAAIPAIGFGTWPMRGEACARMVSEALKIGYRHIDTAQGYQNEADVGAGIAASGVPADDIFVTTKVTPERTSKALLVRSVEESLRKLRRDKVDLLLVHWPNPKIPVGETIAALCDAKRQGLARHIGLSNYTIALTEEALRVATEPLVASQIEYHPLVDQTQDPRDLAAARTGDHRLLPDRAGAGGRQPGDRANRQGARQDGRAGDASLADPAGRRGGDPEIVQSRPGTGEFRRLRLRAERGGDGGDRDAEAARAPRQRSLARARLGLRRERQQPTRRRHPRHAAAVPSCPHARPFPFSG